MNDYHKISETHARWDHNWVAMISYPFEIKIGKVNWLLSLGSINSHPITMCHQTSIWCHDVADPTIILMCPVYKWSVCVSRLCWSPRDVMDGMWRANTTDAHTHIQQQQQHTWICIHQLVCNGVNHIINHEIIEVRTFPAICYLCYAISIFVRNFIAWYQRFGARIFCDTPCLSYTV